MNSDTTHPIRMPRKPLLLAVAVGLSLIPFTPACAAVDILHNFTSGANDGALPYGSLTLSGSTLYGMTSLGGSNNRGAIFSINTDGTSFDLRESFGSASADGAYPVGDLTLSADASTYYGMTNRGGSANAGVVFSKAVPEPSACALGLAALALQRPRGTVKPNRATRCVP